MDSLLVSISWNAPSPELLDVLEEKEKSFCVRNPDNGFDCWIPKSGLQLRKPHEETYENDYVLAAWFRDRLSYRQERVLGVAE